MELSKVESDGEVAMKKAESLFYVEVTPRHVREEPTEEKYLKFTEDVQTSEAGRDVEPDPDVITAGTLERYSTGFVVAEKDNTLRILTCAHTIADIFTSGISPSVDDVNDLFRFDIHCVHHESDILKKRSPLLPSDRQRDVTPVWAIAVDTALDLLVLEVEVDDLAKDKGCRFKHPAIKLSPSDPEELSSVTLVGWPVHKCSSLATGRVSHCVWTYDVITGLNIKGYKMKLLEVHGLVADSGFSGGLMINDQGDCVGLYHGVMNSSMGYGVSHNDLKSFLAKHKMVILPTTSKRH